MLIQTNCGTQVRTKTKRRRCCFNIRKKCCRAVPQIKTRRSHTGNAASSLQATLLTLRVCFSRFYLCAQSKWHGMPSIRTHNKNETWNQTSQLCSLDSWQVEEWIPLTSTGENSKYRGASFTQPIKVQTLHLPRPFMAFIQGPDGCNILMVKADLHFSLKVGPRHCLRVQWLHHHYRVGVSLVFAKDCLWSLTAKHSNLGADLCVKPQVCSHSPRDQELNCRANWAIAIFKESLHWQL